MGIRQAKKVEGAGLLTRLRVKGDRGREGRLPEAGSGLLQSLGLLLNR